MKGRRQTMADKKTILIIDDERDMVKLLRYRLECCGYKVLAAYDGESGLKIIDEGKFDLVILDIMLPRLSGFDICKQLKSDSRTKGIIIIILSAKGMKGDIEKGLKSGADYYLTKPFEPDELEKIIKRMFSGEGN